MGEKYYPHIEPLKGEILSFTLFAQCIHYLLKFQARLGPLTSNCCCVKSNLIDTSSRKSDSPVLNYKNPEALRYVIYTSRPWFIQVLHSQYF